MSRNWKLYLEDMKESVRRVLEYTKGLDQKTFLMNGLVYDATLRNLEILGEAAKHIPEIHTAPIRQATLIILNQLDIKFAALQDNISSLTPYESVSVFIKASSRLSGCWLHPKWASRQDP